MVSRLAELCEIQIAIVLANKSEFKKEILRLPELDIDHIFWHSETEPWFENMDEKVLDILKKLPFEFREKILSSLVIFCLSQSIEWAKFHNKIFDLPLDYSFSFLRSSFFTSKGTIDNEKAAREILKDSEISFSIRFCIACYYCFSDIIHSLWEQLPENTRHEIDNGNVLGIGGDNRIVEIWSQFLLGKHGNECDSFSFYKIKKLLDNYVHNPCDDDDDDDDDDYCYRRHFDPDAHGHYDDESCKNCKDVPFKNCFKELNELEIKDAVIFSREEIKHFLENLESFDDRLRDSDTILSLFPLQLNLPFQQYIEIVLFLFRHLDDEQLKIFFEPEMLYFVWFHLLSWPYHNMFMVTMNKFLDIFPTKGFCLILQRIVDLMSNNVSGKLCDYHNILRRFWMQSPSPSKMFFFRCEGNKKRNIYEIFTEEEENNFKSGLECEFADLCKFEWSVICDLFRLPFTSEDEKIIRMIFESATLEEKSAFVRLKGIEVSEIAFQTCDLKKIDLFIELCLVNERVTSFKKGLFHEKEIKDILFHFVRHHELKNIQSILNWAFSAEEIKEWQQSLFLQYLKKYFYYWTFKDLKHINEFLEWYLSSDEIKSFKESLISDVEDIASHYKYNILKGNFQDINNLLNGIFSSENEIVKYKKRLAFQIIRHMDCSSISSDLNLLTKLVKWSSPTEEECKDFKRHFAFRGETVESYSKFVAQGQFYQTDEFIQWAELNESEMKAFKKLLVFNEQENVISSCVSFTLNSKPDFIKELINWTQFSEEEVREFNLYINIAANNTKLSDIKDFLSGFPLSESEIKRHKKDILLKSIDIIEYFILEDRWDEAEELLNWCFSSKTEFCKFKKNIPLNVSNLCLNLILHQRFDDVDKFCSWTGICDSSKKTLLSKIIFDSRIYEIVSGWFVLLNNNRIEGLLNFLSSHKILSTNWEESFLNWYYEKKKQRECYNSKCCRIFRWHDYYECRKHSDYEFLCGLCKKFIADSERFSELIEKEINKSENRQKRKLESSFDDNTKEAKRSLLS